MALQGLKRKFADDPEGLQQLLELANRLKPEEGNVFNVSPSEIVREPNKAKSKFSTKYGLVDIIYDDMPGYDPFYHRVMNMDAVSTLHDCFGKQGCWNATAAYNDPTKQEDSGGVNAVMILGFRLFTRYRGSSSSKGKFDMRVEECDNPDTNDDVDALVEDQRGGSKSREKSGHKLIVFNPKYKVPANPEGAVLSIVCVRKMRVLLEHLLQSGAYGLDDLLENTHDKEKWFRPPVVLEVWDADYWYYGILEVDYFVMINSEGAITEASLNQFPKEEQAPIGKKFTRCFTQDEVLGLLSKWRARLDPSVGIPERLHPVGRLFIRKRVLLYLLNSGLVYFVQDFSMPRYAEDAAFLTVGAKRFYEGNLRQLVGKSVWKWTAQDVVKGFYSRNEEQKQLHDEIDAPEWVKEALFPDIDADALATKYGYK